MHLSKRLQTIAQQVPAGARLADIGSDHAYLPIYLVQHEQIVAGVAGEVVNGPFQLAKSHVAQQGLSDRITVRLADGLAAIHASDQIDAITIAGMGGSLITSILTAGKAQLTGRETLILEPNVGEQRVREWLRDANYSIAQEALLAEDGHSYEVITAVKAKQTNLKSLEDVMFGPLLRREHSDLFVVKWRNQLVKAEHLAKQLQQAQVSPIDKIQQTQKEIEAIQEVLK